MGPRSRNGPATSQTSRAWWRHMADHGCWRLALMDGWNVSNLAHVVERTISETIKANRHTNSRRIHQPHKHVGGLMKHFVKASALVDSKTHSCQVSREHNIYAMYMMEIVCPWGVATLRLRNACRWPIRDSAGNPYWTIAPPQTWYWPLQVRRNMWSRRQNSASCIKLGT